MAMFSLLLYRHIERKLWQTHKVVGHFRIDASATGATQENNLAVVLICRDVEDYIDEWIRYHELAGVRHFYIYDNGSADSTAAKASAHHRQGTYVKVHPWKLNIDVEGWSLCPQVTAYVHAALFYGSRHRWMAFIDIDEFIVPRQHATAIEALDRLREHSNISLSWSQFGHCGHKSKPSEPCVFAYTQRHQHNKYGFQHFKCILDPCQITMHGVHACHTLAMGEKTSNDQGQVEAIGNRAAAAGFVSSEYLQLNHYETKSIEEHEAKLSKIFYGHSVSERISRAGHLIDRLSKNVVHDNAAIDFLSRHGINDSYSYSQYINGSA